MKKFSVTWFLFFAIANLSFAQNLFFKDSGHNKIFLTKTKRSIIPDKYRGLTFCFSKAKKFLLTLPDESKITDRKLAPVMSLIKPDGSVARFRVWKSNVQEAGTPITDDYVHTFAGQGIDDLYATIRFDFSKYGFHAQILTPNGDYFIDPYARSETKKYISYFRVDLKGGGRPPDIVESQDSLIRRRQ